MTVTTVKAVSERFLKNPNPEVLAIKGTWGAGKTYAWHRIVEDNKDTAALKHYCYVSLFGISSISQLAMSIFAKSLDIELVGAQLTTKNIKKEWLPRLKAIGRNLASNAQKLDFPFSKNLAVGVEQLASYMITKTIICLDDFERSTKITPEEVLGFISYLTEEKGCKVVLIFNEEKLGDKQEIYTRYREKIVDIELLFAPSPKEAAGLAFSPNLPCRELVEKHALTLGIANIRLLKKIAGTIDLVSPHLEALHPGVMQQTVASVVLFAWAYYDTNESTPDLAFILGWNSFKRGIAKEEDKLKNEKWAAILGNYGFTYADEFDLAISKVIENGYIEETGFVREAKKLDAQLKANDLENSFTQAWSIFHDSFEHNEDELIAALRESFKKSCKQISPMNLNSTVRLIRNLGHDDIADEMIAFYIENREDEHSLFDLEDSRNFPFAQDIDDPTLLDLFRTANKKNVVLPSLLDSVKAVAKNHGWSKEQIQVIEQATVDDYYNLFMENRGDDLTLIIQSSLWFETVAGRQYLAKNPRAALERIGKLSPLNALRVRRFGVIVEEPAEPAVSPQKADD